MPTATDFPARGKIVEARDGIVVFQPENTTYELHLATQGVYDGPINRPIEGLIRVKARKAWTVTSGGLWVAPIAGRPRTIQGRVRLIEGNQLVLHAGTPFLVDLPEGDATLSLLTGPIALNHMVNVVAFPGSRFELLTAVPA
jgi:hypothetical protein